MTKKNNKETKVITVSAPILRAMGPVTAVRRAPGAQMGHCPPLRSRETTGGRGLCRAAGVMASHVLRQHTIYSRKSSIYICHQLSVQPPGTERGERGRPIRQHIRPHVSRLSNGKTVLVVDSNQSELSCHFLNCSGRMKAAL